MTTSCVIVSLTAERMHKAATSGKPVSLALQKMRTVVNSRAFNWRITRHGNLHSEGWREVRAVSAAGCDRRLERGKIQIRRSGVARRRDRLEAACRGGRIAGCKTRSCEQPGRAPAARGRRGA